MLLASHKPKKYVDVICLTMQNLCVEALMIQRQISLILGTISYRHFNF